MRTLPEALIELKQLDDKTAITLTALRRMVNKEEIPVVFIGCKRLINLDQLIENLANPKPRQVVNDYGVIRRIDDNSRFIKRG